MWNDSVSFQVCTGIRWSAWTFARLRTNTSEDSQLGIANVFAVYLRSSLGRMIHRRRTLHFGQILRFGILTLTRSLAAVMTVAVAMMESLATGDAQFQSMSAWLAQRACSEGAVGGCNLSADPAHLYEHTYRWVFDDGAIQVVNEVQQPSTSWSGVLVASGDIRVVVRVGGSDMVVASRIAVTPRTGAMWTWKAVDISRGDLDPACFSNWALGAPDVGLAANNNCAAYPIQPNDAAGTSWGVGSGPNDDIYYVTWHSYHFNLHNGAHPVLRPGGPTYYVKPPDPCEGSGFATYAYDNNCRFEPNYNCWYHSILDHEDRHIDLGLDAIQLVENNLPAKVESIVADGLMGLDMLITAAYDDYNLNVYEAVKVPDNPYDPYWYGNVWLYNPDTQWFVYVQETAYR